MQTDEQIQRIEAKVQLLLKEFFQTQREVHRLQKENEELQQQLQLYKQKTSELSQTIDVMKINALSQTDESKKELEKRINIYLREIDKCLMMLQS